MALLTRRDSDPNKYKRQRSFLENCFEVRIHSNIYILSMPAWFQKLFDYVAVLVNL